MEIKLELKHQYKGESQIMKAFLTVIGKDKVGIVADNIWWIIQIKCQYCRYNTNDNGWFFHNGSYGRFRKKP